MKTLLKIYQKIKKHCPFLIVLFSKVFPFVHYWDVYDFLYRISHKEKVFYHEMSGSRFVVDLTDKNKFMRWIMYNYLMLKEYEPETTKLVREIVKPGDTVIDIGASIGYFTYLTSKLVGEKGNVYAIEPTEQGFNYLCRNREANVAWNVHPYKMAVWDKEEPVFVPLNAEGPNRIWANGIRIDEFCRREGIKKVDFIKCDVDGAEPQVLKGLIETFENNPQLKMVFEFYPKYIRNAGGDPNEVLEILNKYFVYEPIKGDYGNGYWNFFCQRKL